MTTTPTLYCRQRELNTRGYLKQMRKNGLIPGVIYGQGETGQSILLDAKEVKRTFVQSGTRGIFMLNVEGAKAPLMVLIRELQKSPIGEGYIHIDFLSLKSNEKVNNVVGIHLLGEEQLSGQGKFLQIMTKEMEISCLPADIPEGISFDISNLDIGDKVTFGDITLPPNVELLQDPDTVICIVMAQNKAAEPEEIDTGNAAPEPAGD